jgi:hypothetical protein
MIIEMKFIKWWSSARIKIRLSCRKAKNFQKKRKVNYKPKYIQKPYINQGQQNI